jgi:DNA-binding response OmpR family regulator
MNRRFAELTRVRAEFESFLKQLGQGPEGGLAILREVRRRAPHVPVVFLTRKGTLADALRARDAGADAVLHKPQPPGQADASALDRAMADQADALAARFRTIIKQHAQRSRWRLALAVLLVFVIGLVAGWLLCAAWR